MNLDLFENRAQQIARLTSRWPPEELRKHSKALGDFESGRISFDEMTRAIEETKGAPKTLATAPTPVVWQGSDEQDALSRKIQRWGGEE
jgi:hypothetical protein